MPRPEWGTRGEAEASERPPVSWSPNRVKRAFQPEPARRLNEGQDQGSERALLSWWIDRAGKVVVSRTAKWDD